jgi:hypothetical protein
MIFQNPKIQNLKNTKYKNTKNTKSKVCIFPRPPKKFFFRRPAAGDLDKPRKIPCRTGRRESYRVILV